LVSPIGGYLKNMVRPLSTQLNCQ